MRFLPRALFAKRNLFSVRWGRGCFNCQTRHVAIEQHSCSEATSQADEHVALFIRFAKLWIVRVIVPEEYNLHIFHDLANFLYVCFNMSKKLCLVSFAGCHLHTSLSELLTLNPLHLQDLLQNVY